MKLYTEDQVRKAFEDGYLYHASVGLTVKEQFERQIKDTVDSLTPIEQASDAARETAGYYDRHVVQAMVQIAKDYMKLPSDEEIENKVDNYTTEFSRGFKAGAKWVTQQIKQQEDGLK